MGSHNQMFQLKNFVFALLHTLFDCQVFQTLNENFGHLKIGLLGLLATLYYMTLNLHCVTQ